MASPPFSRLPILPLASSISSLTNLHSIRLNWTTFEHVRPALPRLTRLELQTEENRKAAHHDVCTLSEFLLANTQLTDLRLLDFESSTGEKELLDTFLRLENLIFLSLPYIVSDWGTLEPLSKLQTLVVSDFHSSMSLRYLPLCRDINVMEMNDFRDIVVPKLRRINANVLAQHISPANGEKHVFSFMAAAARAPGPSSLEWMLASGVPSFNLTIRDLSGRTPLMWVRYMLTLEFLLEKGANPNAVATGSLPHSSGIKESTLLSELASVTSLVSTPSIVDAVLLAIKLLKDTDVDPTLGSPPAYVVALRAKSRVLKAIARFRPDILKGSSYERIVLCFNECNDAKERSLVLRLLPPEVSTRLLAGIASDESI